MKYITLNFRGGGKIKLPTNILKSIDVPDDFTVNREGKDEEEIKLIPIGQNEEEGGVEVVAYVNSNTEKLGVGIEVYGDENGNTPASDGQYDLYENIDIEVPSGVYAFIVEDGQVSELRAEEEPEPEVNNSLIDI